MPKNIGKITQNNKNSITHKALLIVGAVLVLSLAGNFVLIKKNYTHESHDNIAGAVIKQVSAQEIYPLFICPCCGKTIDTPCCGMARERRNYVEALTQGKLSKDEVISAYVRKYGLNSFKDEVQKESFREKLVQEAPSDRPIISLTPEVYDFGEVSQSMGRVSTFFEIQNKGQSDLIIDKIETSCGCTSASIVYQGEEGPKFAMPGHGINEEIGDWQVSIAPDETAQLKVYYDPNMHQDFRGTAVREIHVFSNDPIDFEKEVSIELEQVD